MLHYFSFFCCCFVKFVSNITFDTGAAKTGYDEDGDMNDVINNAISLLPDTSEILASLGGTNF